jgi:hypothetical protein
VSTEQHEEYLSKARLRAEFGLTDALVARLGPPDRTAANPHYRKQGRRHPRVNSPGSCRRKPREADQRMDLPGTQGLGSDEGIGASLVGQAQAGDDGDGLL